MGKWQAGGGERPLERERAPEQETHEIVAPVPRGVRGLVDEFAVDEDAVARKVGLRSASGASVMAGGSGVGHFEKRARLRIAHTKASEIERVVSRQNERDWPARNPARARSSARRSGRCECVLVLRLRAPPCAKP